MNEQQASFTEGLKQLPPAFHDWVASLGWRLEDITGIATDREILPDPEAEAEKGHGWVCRKPGPHFTVTVSRGDERHEAVFNVSTGEWKLEKSRVVPTRDMHFIGYAKALVTEIINQVPATIYPLGIDISEKLEKLLARRAYDLVEHTIIAIDTRDLDMLETHECVECIPDMPELPEVEA